MQTVRNSQISYRIDEVAVRKDRIKLFGIWILGSRRSRAACLVLQDIKYIGKTSFTDDIASYQDQSSEKISKFFQR